MQSGDCLPGFTNQCGESSPDRQAMRRVPPELSKPVRRASHRPPRRERVPRFSRTKRRLLPPCCPYNAASYSRPPHRERASPASPNCPTNAASFPNCPNQCGESPHAPPNSGRVSFASPNFAANCAQNKNSTALTIGNEGIQIQWPSRAHTRKHEAALPPVLMFFL